MLDRDAAMRLLVRHGRDDAGLPVAPLDGADAGGPAQRRVLPSAAATSLVFSRVAVGQRAVAPVITRLHRDTPAAANSLRLGRVAARSNRARRNTVLDDIAERRVATNSRWS